MMALGFVVGVGLYNNGVWLINDFWALESGLLVALIGVAKRCYAMAKMIAGLYGEEKREFGS
jgi:hypothetical protein